MESFLNFKQAQDHFRTVINLRDNSKAKNINVVGIVVDLQFQNGYILFLCDPTVKSFEIKLAFTVDYTKYLPGNVVELRKLKVNKKHCFVDEDSLVTVYNPFGDENGSASEAAKAMIQWYSDEILKISMETLPLNSQSSRLTVAGQVIWWKMKLEKLPRPYDVVCIWDGSAPKVELCDPFADEIEPHMISRREDEHLINSTKDLITGNSKSIAVKVFCDALNYDKIRPTIQPGDFILFINGMLCKRDDKYEMTLHRSNEKSVRMVSKQSYLGMKLKERIENHLIDLNVSLESGHLSSFPDSIIDSVTPTQPTCVTEANETILPALLVSPLPRIVHTVDSFLTLGEASETYCCIEAKSIDMLPSEMTLESIIYLECPTCSFSDSLEVIMGRELKNFMKLTSENGNALKVPHILCPVCLEEQNRVKMYYGFKIIYVISSGTEKLMMVNLSEHTTAVVGRHPKEALSCREAAYDVINYLRAIAPSSGRKYNWIISSECMGNVYKHNVISVTSICSSQKRVNPAA